ncbi:MAG: DUF3945 domain-containing protein [Rikenellaceae bacterium]
MRLSQQQHNDLYAGKKIWIDGMTMNSGSKHSGFAKLSEDGTKIQISKRIIPFTLGGVKLTTEQQLALDDGKAIFMSGMVSRDNRVYDCYVKYSDEKQGLNYYRSNPDEPVQQQQQAQPYSQAHSQEQEHNQSNSFVSGGLGLFDLPSGNGTDIDDIENEQMARNLKPKKKRGRGI